MTFRNEALHATGHAALDEHGTKVGTVVDVLFDREGEAKWAVVDPGPLRKAHYAPLDGAYATDSGDVILPVDVGQVKHAPVAGRKHILTHELEEELVAHYGVS
jgi:hypothetical protein